MDAKGLHDFYFNELKWCGCGNPEEALQFVGNALDILKRRSDSNNSAEDRGRPYGRPYEETAWAAHTKELLAVIGGWDSMLGLIFMYVLDAHGLTEHGGNVNGSWLTPKGEEVLAAIKQYGNGEWFDPIDSGDGDGG